MSSGSHSTKRCICLPGHRELGSRGRCPALASERDMESSLLSCTTDLLFLSRLCGHSEHAELFQPQHPRFATSSPSQSVWPLPLGSGGPHHTVFVRTVPDLPSLPISAAPSSFLATWFPSSLTSLLSGDLPGVSDSFRAGLPAPDSLLLPPSTNV